MKSYPDHLTNKYEMLECLASHDYSETILSVRRTDEKLCVIKVFFSDSPLYDFVVPDEIKKLEHPRIPEFLDEYKSESLRYEVREFVPGVSLDKLVQRKSLSKHEKEQIVRQLCDLLNFLHRRPVSVIHRDIKPQNIIISDSGDLYLIDFGIARTRKNVPELSDTVICTTRDFSAPEQYGFMETDCRSDIYSFGQVLKWLYYDDSGELDPVIKKCTAFDPDKRYSSIKDVQRAIEYKRKQQKLIPLLLTIIISVICLAGVYLFLYNRINFREPLIEDAVRLSLGVGKLHPLSDSDLQKVSGIYIVADTAYSNSDEFYEAVNEWYMNDRDSEGPVASLEDCSQLNNLSELCIAGNNVSDLTPLVSCGRLEKLELKHNKIPDISVLEQIPTIVSVGLNGNPVTDISPLIKLNKLRYLDTCNVKIADPSVFEKLGNFEYLDIDNGTQAYKYLSGKTIHNLRLGNIFTKDLYFLMGIKELRTVQLNFINYDKIRELGEVDFEVIYEGIDVPIQDIPYTNKVRRRTRI